MIVMINDWKLDVDIVMNMECSCEQTADHCLCGYCRNYYAAVDGTYPAMRPFLAQFGLDIEGPDELCPFEPTIYEATYIVNGRILQKGSGLFSVDGVPVKICDNTDIETRRVKPFFLIIIGLMELPWLLDEPMEDVISPANENAYMERMWDKLLRRLDNEETYS